MFARPSQDPRSTRSFVSLSTVGKNHRARGAMGLIFTRGLSPGSLDGTASESCCLARKDGYSAPYVGRSFLGRGVDDRVVTKSIHTCRVDVGNGECCRDVGRQRRLELAR